MILLLITEDGVFLGNKLLLITGSGQVVLEGSGHFWNTNAYRLAREDKLNEGPSSIAALKFSLYEVITTHG